MNKFRMITEEVATKWPHMEGSEYIVVNVMRRVNNSRSGIQDKYMGIENVVHGSM